MINQVLGSPLAGGIARLLLRARAPQAFVAQAVGPARRAVSAPRPIASSGRAKTEASATAPRFGCTRERCLALASSRLANARDADARRDSRPGPRTGRARISHEQRGLRLAVYRPSHRAGTPVRAGGHEPAEPGAGRRASMGRARLPRWRRELRAPTRCSCSARRYRDADGIACDSARTCRAERLQHEVGLRR